MSFSSAINDAISQVNVGITALDGAYGAMEVIGFKLFALLAVIAIAWFGLQLLIEGGSIDGVMGGFLRSIMMLGLAYWFMQGHNLYDFVDSLAKNLVDVFNGVSTNQDGNTGMFRGAAAIGDAIQHLINPGGNASWMSIIETIGSQIIHILFLCLAVVVMLISALIYFIISEAGVVLMALAKMLSPVFIPWLILPATSFLFDSWLKFLIGAAFYKIIAAAFVMFGNGAIQAVVNKLTSPDYKSMPWGESVVMAIAAAALCALIAYLMLQVPSFASALVGGASVSLRGIIPKKTKNDKPDKPDKSPPPSPPK